MEKEIVLTELKGHFLKDFDTFGKMDCFLEVSVGKHSGKTEIAQGQGKEPVWTTPISLSWLFETEILVNAYDDDATECEFIGSALIQISSLKQSGTLEVKLHTLELELIGTVTCKYTVKTLPQSPFFAFKKLRLTDLQEKALNTKNSYYLKISTDNQIIETKTKEQDQTLDVVWVQYFYLRVKEDAKFSVSLFQKGKDKDSIFDEQISVKEFRLIAGSKRINLFGKDHLHFGVLLLDFETMNLVTKQQSAKNSEKLKKAESELTSLKIDKIRGDLKKQVSDLSFNVLLCGNLNSTQTLPKAQKNFLMEPKLSLYYEAGETKLLIAMQGKKTFLGFAIVQLDSIGAGQQKLALRNDDKQDVGTIYVTFVVKQVPLKLITFSNVSVGFTEGGDFFSESQPYVIARIAGWSAKTEIGQKNKSLFKTPLNLKYSSEQFVIFEVWDENVIEDEKVFQEKVPLSDLVNLKGETKLVYLNKDEGGKLLHKGELKFKVQMKTMTYVAPEKASAPKTESSKVIDPKKEEAQKKETLLAEEAKKKELEQKAEEIRKGEEIRKAQEKRKNDQLKKADEAKKAEEHKSVPQHQQNAQEKKNQGEQKQDSQKAIRRQSQIKAPQSKIDSNRQVHRHDSSTLNRSLQRSKNSIRLPSIGENVNFGDRIYDKQSASTLQKSIHVYSVPKASRFDNGPRPTGEPSYYVDTCFKVNSMKGAGFGFGTKRQFPQWLQRNMKQNPAPGAYFDSSVADSRPVKGPTFGLPHRFYEKVMIPKEEKKISAQNIRKLSPIKEK